MYPYEIEIVSSKRVSIPRPMGAGVVVYETLHVDLPLWCQSLPGFSSCSAERRREGMERVLEQAKDLAFEKFVLFLQIVAEYQSVFPKELLRGPHERDFFVLLPLSLWPKVRQSQNLPLTGGEALRVRMEEAEFELLWHPRLAEDEAYLVGRGKYRLYLHLHELCDEIRVFRSDFLDISTRSNAPLFLRAKPFLATLFRDGVCRTSLRSTEKSPPPATCPRCRGRLVYLAPGEAFCISCDWDNLKTLPTSRLDELF